MTDVQRSDLIAAIDYLRGEALETGSDLELGGKHRLRLLKLAHSAEALLDKVFHLDNPAMASHRPARVDRNARRRR